MANSNHSIESMLDRLKKELKLIRSSKKINNILIGYCAGMSEDEICHAYGILNDQVVEILDMYTQYL